MYENDTYKIVVTDNAIGEDGKYGQPGYALVNKETDIVEQTSMMYPALLSSAAQLEDAIEFLTKEEEKPVAQLVEMTTEDVVPN